jgi:hypothetical protein
MLESGKLAVQVAVQVLRIVQFVWQELSKGAIDG